MDGVPHFTDAPGTPLNQMCEVGRARLERPTATLMTAPPCTGVFHVKLAVRPSEREDRIVKKRWGRGCGGQ
jgi:hypothetical protein